MCMRVCSYVWLDLQKPFQTIYTRTEIQFMLHSSTIQTHQTYGYGLQSLLSDGFLLILSPWRCTTGHVEPVSSTKKGVSQCGTKLLPTTVLAHHLDRDNFCHLWQRVVALMLLFLGHDIKINITQNCSASILSNREIFTLSLSLLLQLHNDRDNDSKYQGVCNTSQYEIASYST